MISKWPEYDPTLSFADEEAQMEKIMDAIRAIRNRRAEMNIPPAKSPRSMWRPPLPMCSP